MAGDRVRNGVGDGKLRSTSIRRGTASRQEVEKSSQFCATKVAMGRRNEIHCGVLETAWNRQTFGNKKTHSRYLRGSLFNTPGASPVR
jgi:hypothetical protein